MNIDRLKQRERLSTTKELTRLFNYVLLQYDDWKTDYISCMSLRLSSSCLLEASFKNRKIFNLCKSVFYEAVCR